MEPIRVLVVDDNALVRDSLATALTAHDGFECAGTAANGTKAVDLTVSLLPDVVLMDLHLPDINGIEATRRIATVSPSTAVVVLTMFSDDTSVFAAMRAGARGYLVKGAGHREILHAIEAAARGEAIFGPAIADLVLGYFSGPPPQPQDAFPELTPREREVLELLARGEQNASIARQLNISPKTVRNHLSNVFLKLQVADRAQAMIRARDAGLGHNDRSA
jgi:DNA-binding NarL/FixJ family response regulator